MLELLTLGITDILDHITLGCEKDSMDCKRFSNIPGLYPLNQVLKFFHLRSFLPRKNFVVAVFEAHLAVFSDYS